MATVNVLVLRTAGTNCDGETCYAFEKAGAKTRRVHVNEMIGNPKRLGEYQVLVIAGGFSYGDDIAAGKILANQLIHHFRQDVRAFIDAGKLVLGICNGFQVLVKAGLLPGLDNGAGEAVSLDTTITNNDSGKFEDRWIYLQPGTDKCVFLKGIERMYLPIAHGEGKVCFAREEILERVKANGQVALRYVDEHGNFGGFPVNPNGSTDHIAGLCDPTGRVLGLMPHPERHVHPTHHPQWTRRAALGLPGTADGLAVFVNAVNYFS